MDERNDKGKATRAADWVAWGQGSKVTFCVSRRKDAVCQEVDTILVEYGCGGPGLSDAERAFKVWDSHVCL